jgi:hypothetical protein
MDDQDGTGGSRSILLVAAICVALIAAWIVIGRLSGPPTNAGLAAAVATGG